ncbi:MAG: hypothetical protein GY849_21695, partial [Deltaproteobacteria bacterium]|nr:hypothetical protein [Deltaproteobacteria bacterium]
GKARPFLERLKEDEAEIQMYRDGRLMKRRVKELAEEAFMRLASEPDASNG